MGGFNRLWHLIYHQYLRFFFAARLDQVYFSRRGTIDDMEIKPHIIRAGIAWALLLGFMLGSQPQKLPVLLLIVPFVLLFVALMSTWVAVVPIARRLVGKRGYAGSPRLRITVCGSSVLLIIMQSLGQLTARDSLTILAIATIGYLYIGRSRSEQQGK